MAAVAGTAISNHQASVVTHVPNSGFVAAHDTAPVAMISTDGNLWGPVATDRVLGALQMVTVGADAWGIDAVLPLNRMLVKASSGTYPTFENTELGVAQLTDAVNCWAVGPSEILLLERGGRITRIPRGDIRVAAAGTPGAPQNVSVTTGSGRATVSFAAPASAGTSPVTSYSVEWTADDGATWTAVSTPSSPATVSNLTNGRSLFFRVGATNGSGIGEYSAWTAAVTPMPQIPGAPTQVVARWATLLPGQSRRAQRIEVSWSAPADNGGAPITGYTVQLHDGSYTCAVLTTPVLSVSQSPETFVPLRREGPAGYRFRVFAVNMAGNGFASDPSNPLPSAT